MTELHFDDSAIVHIAPRWLAPAYIWLTNKIGAQRVLRFFAIIPAKRKRIGLCVFGKSGTTITPDRRHCLLMKPEWQCWAIYRATSDVQRYGWHGISVETPAVYVSPNLLDR